MKTNITCNTLVPPLVLIRDLQPGTFFKGYYTGCLYIYLGIGGSLTELRCYDLDNNIFTIMNYGTEGYLVKELDITYRI